MAINGDIPKMAIGRTLILSIIIHHYHHITMGVGVVLGFMGPNFPLLCCLQHRLHMALLAIYWVPGPVLILFYTHHTEWTPTRR